MLTYFWDQIDSLSAHRRVKWFACPNLKILRSKIRQECILMFHCYTFLATCHWVWIRFVASVNVFVTSKKHWDIHLYTLALSRAYGLKKAYVSQGLPDPIWGRQGRGVCGESKKLIARGNLRNVGVIHYQIRIKREKIQIKKKDLRLYIAGNFTYRCSLNKKNCCHEGGLQTSPCLSLTNLPPPLSTITRHSWL